MSPIFVILPWFLVSFLLYESNLLGRNGCQYLIYFGLIISPLTAWYLVYDILNIVEESKLLIKSGRMGLELTLINIYQWNITLCLSYSISEVLCILLLTQVAYCIHVYALWYSWSDPQYTKFLSILSFFTGSMSLLFVSSDIISLFISWELIGIASFLLVSYYNNRIEAVRAGMKAILYNRLGDVAFLLSIVLGLSIFYDNNIIIWQLLCTNININVNNYLGLGLIIASWCKSAQFGLNPWLLDAMEGPTPVSALLHSATLVTAGVILLWKLGNIAFGHSSLAILCFVLGALTALFSSITAICYFDLKRVVAYSTCTHIALMIMSQGISGIDIYSGSVSDTYQSSIWHLFLHGWAKSLLFMLCGLILHQLHQQDIRLLGGVVKQIPIAFTFTNICLLAIQGCPGSSISESKDYILEFGFCSISGSGFLWIIASIVWLGQGYCLAIIFHCWNESYNYIPNLHSITHTNWNVIFPLFLLLINVIFIPYIFSNVFSPSALEITERIMQIDPFGIMCLIGLLLGVLRIKMNSNLVKTPYDFIHLILNRMYCDKIWSNLMLYLSHLVIYRIQPHFEYGYVMHLLSPLMSSKVNTLSYELNWSLFAYVSLILSAFIILL
mmetsp:Transcript_15881/g.28135  ORF Transcript_15881/g.28135 Transcript_15881/m.28135 type:complete len:613 (-) Transcript_15881:73-1911(-)